MEAQLIRRLLLLPAFLLTLTCLGQPGFYKVYSGNGYDRGEGVAQLPDSGYVVTGTSSSFDEAPSQAFLLRIDKLGNYVWSQAYGGPEFEEGKRVLPVPGHGYYVVGTSSSGASANFDVHLFFTDELGAFQWQKFTDMGGWERTNDAVMLADTSIFVVGETDTSGNSDILLARYDKTGNVMWKKHIGSEEGDDYAYSVISSTDTTVLIAGTWYVADSSLNKAYIAEIHIDGSVVWEKTYGDVGRYQLNTLWKGGGYIKAMGQRYKNVQSGWDAFALIVNDAGVFAGQDDTYSVGNEARYTHMVKYTAGNTDKFFAVHQTIADWTFPEGEDAYISRYNGGLYWDGYGVGYNGIGQDQFNELAPTLDGFAVGVGYHTQYGGGGNSVFVVKIGDANYFPANSANPTPINIVSVAELIELKGLNVYPNPVSDLLTITVPETEFSYALFDASGKQLTSGNAWGNQQLDFSGQASGVYFLRIAHASGESTTVKVVK